MMHVPSDDVRAHTRDVLLPGPRQVAMIVPLGLRRGHLPPHADFTGGFTTSSRARSITESWRPRSTARRRGRSLAVEDA